LSNRCLRRAANEISWVKDRLQSTAFFQFCGRYTPVELMMSGGAMRALHPLKVIEK
jgi:hypothetical protein